MISISNVTNVLVVDNENIQQWINAGVDDKTMTDIFNRRFLLKMKFMNFGRMSMCKWLGF